MDSKLQSLLKALALFLIFTLCAAPDALSSQHEQTPSPGQPFKLEVRTHLVLIPVIVTDKGGSHVTGLTANDFEIKEDGKVQTLVRLDELSAESSKVAASQVRANSFTNQVVAEHPKKLEIIALDQVNTPFANSRDGNRMLVEFLAGHIDGNTLLALVALTHNGPRIVHNFTADPSLLIAAVKKLRAGLNSRDTRTLNSPGDSSEADFEALQIAALLNGAEFNAATTASDLAASARASIQAAHAQVDASRQSQEALITLENFQQLSQYFGGVPGRKSLIWASTGFPFTIGANAQSTTRGTTADDWQRTFQMLTDANIAVYPVDIGGLLPGANANTIQQVNSSLIKAGGPEGGVGGRSAQLGAMERGEFTDPTVGRHATMGQLADMTGGQAFYNSNDGAELFRRAGDDAGQYYMLAYYTSDTGKYGWRKLTVRVGRPDVKVRARSGFFFSDPTKAAGPAVSIKDLRMAMTSDLSFTSMPLRGEWAEIEPAGKQKKVHFVLSIPAGVTAIDLEHQNHVSLEFVITATDPLGKEAANISQRYDTKLSPDGLSQIQTQGLDYANMLTLAPNNYKVHFVVRDNLRGTLGSMVTPLKVE